MKYKILNLGDEDLLLEFLQWLTPETLDTWFPYGSKFNKKKIKGILANPNELRIAGIDKVKTDIAKSYNIPPERERIVVYGQLYHFIMDSCRLGIVAGITGKGYGTQMMRILINFAKVSGAKYIYLSTQINNYPALALYKKFGFKIIKTFTDRPRHNYEMRKTL